jgi:hypothetical protein
MEKETRNKLIGLAMLLPLPAYAVYVLLFSKIWLVVLCFAITGGMFHYGLKLVSGESLKDIEEHAVGKLNHVEDRAEEAVDKLKG